jgi:hypothetical protein
MATGSILAMAWIVGGATTNADAHSALALANALELYRVSLIRGGSSLAASADPWFGVLSRRGAGEGPDAPISTHTQPPPTIFCLTTAVICSCFVLVNSAILQRNRMRRGVATPARRLIATGRRDWRELSKD